MIHAISTSAHFPAIGATLRGDFQPQSGITAVVGENGAGKTLLTVETVRWLLFGKAALRGAAADYKESLATGRLTIGTETFEISRGGQEWVKDASGDKVAVGAEKVTEYLTDKLGYDLSVFDLCNAATQGQLQKLGDMRPAERKAIVDRVLRLTSAEKAEKDCREEATGYRREAEALVKTLRAPGDKPQEPAGYTDAAQMEDDLKVMRERRAQLEALRGRLRHIEMPEYPQVADFDEIEIYRLEKHESERTMIFLKRSHANRFGGKVDWTLDQLEAASERGRVRDLLADRGPKPVLTKEEIARGWAEHRAVHQHQTSEPVTCPKCDHTFRPTGEAPTDPTWPASKLQAEEARQRAWPDDGPALPDGLDLTKDQIQHGLEQVRAQQELALLPPELPDRAGELATMRAAQATMEAHLAEQLRFERTRQANTEIETQIAALGDVPSQGEIDEEASRVMIARVYEAQHAAWLRDDAAFKETQEKITRASYLADEFKKGALGIADARATVKALIAPKISQIASSLLSDMTMGKLKNVTVDEDMNITVGSQRLETLSGAGKTVANLALRIAMGQALVKRSFPVFLADEIDGDLSIKRREATLMALVALKKHLKQIILVTHRGVEIADHVIEIKD